MLDQSVQRACLQPAVFQIVLATSALAAAGGAKVTRYAGLRGKYDFMAEIEGTFEQAAAAAMVAVSSGAVSDFTILEDVDLNGIAKTAQKMASSYKEPGK